MHLKKENEFLAPGGPGFRLRGLNGETGRGSEVCPQGLI
jgi:hypothetical protein